MIIIIIIIILPTALLCFIRIYVFHCQPFHLHAKIGNFIYQCITNLLQLIFHFRAVTHHILATNNIRYTLELITNKFCLYFIIIIYLLTVIGLSPGGIGYFTCIQNMELVTNKFKSGGLHEKHVVATWNLWNRLSICL